MICETIFFNLMFKYNQKTNMHNTILTIVFDGQKEIVLL